MILSNTYLQKLLDFNEKNSVSITITNAPDQKGQTPSNWHRYTNVILQIDYAIDGREDFIEAFKDEILKGQHFPFGTRQLLKPETRNNTVELRPQRLKNILASMYGEEAVQSAIEQHALNHQLANKPHITTSSVHKV